MMEQFCRFPFLWRYRRYISIVLLIFLVMAGDARGGLAASDLPAQPSNALGTEAAPTSETTSMLPVALDHTINHLSLKAGSNDFVMALRPHPENPDVIRYYFFAAQKNREHLSAADDYELILIDGNWFDQEIPPKQLKSDDYSPGEEYISRVYDHGCMVRDLVVFGASSRFPAGIVVVIENTVDKQGRFNRRTSDAGPTHLFKLSVKEQGRSGTEAVEPPLRFDFADPVKLDRYYCESPQSNPDLMQRIVAFALGE